MSFRPIKIYNGQHGPIIQVVVARFTPPTEEEKADARIVETLAADLRPSPSRTDHVVSPTMASDPPSQGPTSASGKRGNRWGAGGNPALRSVLGKLWEALEKRERSES